MGKYINDYKPLKDRIGQIGFNKKDEKMKIIEYNLYEDIIVEFMDDNKCQVHTQYINFLTGNVKNYNRVEHGFHGFIGKGLYKSEHRENGKRIVHDNYKIWSGMHRRAGNFDGKHPSYTNVTICEEWWNFQNFAKWYDEHVYTVDDDFICIDKDILYPDSKVYSPKTCCLIPNSINEIFKNFDNYKKENEEGLPNGVQRRTDTKLIRYRSEATYLDEFGNKVKERKTFDNVYDAYYFYKSNKEKYIKQMAEKYKHVLDQRVYNKLIEYEVTTKVDLSSFI